MARYRGRPNRPQRPKTSKGVMFLCYSLVGYILLQVAVAILTHETIEEPELLTPHLEQYYLDRMLGLAD